jgi:uncharacterized protein YndB with AHSA1/START domain
MSQLQARNEILINASASKVWSVITDINLLPKINPGVIAAKGTMDKQGELRTCEMNSKRGKGTMTERLVEVVPEQKTVWTIEEDSMGMKKMLRDTRFCFYLEKQGDNQTKLINESYYSPVGLIAKLMNAFMMKSMMGKIQTKILHNVKEHSER